VYCIEWIGLPKKKPIVISTIETNRSSMEAAMEQATNQFRNARRANPSIAGYRVLRKGEPAPLYIHWEANSPSPDLDLFKIYDRGAPEK